MSSFPAPREYLRRGSRDTIRSLDYPSSFAMATTQLPTLNSYRGPRNKKMQENPLALSLAPELFPEEPDPDLSPTDTTAQHNSFTPCSMSSTASCSPQLRREQHSVTYLSSDSPDTNFTGSLASLGPFSTRSDLLPSRSPSTETVKGPTSNHGPPSPLTGFPPWDAGSDGECERRGWRAADREGTRAAHHHHHHDSARYTPLVLVGVEGRWILSSVLHAVVLAMQFTAALAACSALIWIAVWKKNETDVEFWGWLWKYAEPSLVGVLLLCSATLLAHEVKILSSVALLYLQSAILILTTAASIAMWVRCFGESSRVVKGVLVGCNMLMWGLALFGFVRAVVIWRVEAGREDEARRSDDYCRETRSVSYGTFVPWGEYASRHDRLP